MTVDADAARAAPSRRWAPVAVGLAVAAAAFATVSLADGDGSPPPRVTQATAAAAPSLGRTTFMRMACGSCHRLTAAGTSNDAEIGPDLDTTLAGHTRASLRAQILDPDGAGSIGAMPSFAGRLSAGELDALVTFLLRSRPQR
jgi:mono/diheme cytochrome c family protein